MKTKMKISMLLLIVIASLFIFSCNTENEGIFMRISNSQVKVDVGYVDIIGKNATDLFAYTSEKGFQQFNIASGSWISLDTTVSFPGLYSTNSATATTEIYYAARAVAGETNDLYTLPIGGSESGPDSAYEIVEMKQDNLMLVKTVSVYAIRDGAATSEIVAFDSIFSDSTKPRMITDDSGNFIVSGLGTSTAYRHFYNSTTPNELTSTDTTFDDHPMVAMMLDGTNIVLVDSTGKVWKGTTTTRTDFVSTGTISGWPDRNPADLEYPTFIFTDTTSELYLQNENNDFYKINNAGVISSELDSNFTDFLSGIRIKSYLEDGSTIYAGTMENGIVKITMTAPGVGTAIIL